MEAKSNGRLDEDISKGLDDIEQDRVVSDADFEKRLHSHVAKKANATELGA